MEEMKYSWKLQILTVFHVFRYEKVLETKGVLEIERVLFCRVHLIAEEQVILIFHLNICYPLFLVLNQVLVQQFKLDLVLEL